MTRMMLAAAVAALALAGAAKAQWGTPPAPQGGSGGYAPAPAAESSKERYGFHPLFKKVLWWKRDGCSSGGCKSCGDTTPPYGMAGNPAGMPGTLVFPNHQYNRSPRDFFMWER